MIPHSRRAFLRLLLTTPLAATVDLEQLLWTPRPMVVVPALRAAPLTLAEIDAVTRCVCQPAVLAALWETTPLLAYVRDHVRL